MMRSRNTKKKVIGAILIALVAIGIFVAGLQLLERMGLKDVQYGDSGDWGDEPTETTELSLNDNIYISNDNLDTYLIIGTDSGGVDMGEMYSGELADFVTILLVDNTTQKFVFLQLDRNSMVQMAVPDEHGDDSALETMQLCISHWYGQTAEGRKISNHREHKRLCGFVF